VGHGGIGVDFECYHNQGSYKYPADPIHCRLALVANFLWRYHLKTE
jgi:hypothetical protein